MRKFLTAGLAAFCLAATGGFAPVSAGESDSPRSSYVDDHFEYVPLQLQGGKPATVRQVFLNVAGQVQAADPAAGVERIDQNRLDWSEIPFVGQFANDRYNEADFAPDRAIGDAYFANGAIWLDLSEDTHNAGYPRIEFLNQNYAYRLSAAPAPAQTITLPKEPPGTQIGMVFRDSNGTLLVLVRPFIVTDTPF